MWWWRRRRSCLWFQLLLLSLSLSRLEGLRLRASEADAMSPQIEGLRGFWAEMPGRLSLSVFQSVRALVVASRTII